MKVLFLDIDGVVNCKTTFQTMEKGAIYLDPYMALLVGKIQLDTGCEVVLSSSWRHYPPDIEAVEQRIVKLYDKTPSLDSGFRGDEIAAWLGEHPEVTRYAILDDESDFHPWQPLFKTSWDTGLDSYIAKEVIDYLNDEGDWDVQK